MRHWPFRSACFKWSMPHTKSSRSPDFQWGIEHSDQPISCGQCNVHSHQDLRILNGALTIQMVLFQVVNASFKVIKVTRFQMWHWPLRSAYFKWLMLHLKYSSSPYSHRALNIQISLIQVVNATFKVIKVSELPMGHWPVGWPYFNWSMQHSEFGDLDDFERCIDYMK